MLKQVIQIQEILENPNVTGADVQKLFESYSSATCEYETLLNEKGRTDVVRISISGENSQAPVLGIIGQLGGVGARPVMRGFVSDGDGAVTALAAALKVAEMREHGEELPGDIYVATHICPRAPVIPHEPVPFMGSPIGVREALNHMLKSRKVDAILSIDTTKGNRLINARGFAISPTVLSGYILRVSEDLLDIYERVVGMMPRVLPITTQDITPYGNGVHHINSIMQPCTVLKDTPVVGVALTTEVPVAGCATGASHEVDIELAARFAVEVAKYFGSGGVKFYNKKEFDLLCSLYGDLTHLVTPKEGMKDE